jgi:hypothetical protein
MSNTFCEVLRGVCPQEGLRNISQVSHISLLIIPSSNRNTNYRTSERATLFGFHHRKGCHFDI